jgi:hypothetical protein
MEPSLSRTAAIFALDAEARATDRTAAAAAARSDAGERLQSRE